MSDEVRLDIQLSNFLNNYLNCTLSYNMVIVVYEMANLLSYSMFSSKVPCYPLLELQIAVYKLI